MGTTGIYKIESLSHPDRCYIGSAVYIENRWRLHLFKLKNNKHHSHFLQRHYNKYEKNDLKFSIIILVDKHDLINVEQYWIDTLKPKFNECKIAGNTLGYHHSNEAKIIMSKKRKGKAPGNKGKHPSNETRKLQSDAKINCHLTNKHKLNIKNSMLIFCASKEGKKIKSISMIGNKNACKK